jgi:exonuclease SbcD
MRILHTADWHLGRIFHGLHLTEEQAYVLDQLVALTKEAKTDAVLIAGDIYDRAVPPTQAVELLNETLNRLIKEAGQKVILIAGNHDNPERLGFASELLAGQNLFIYGPLAKTAAPVVLPDQFGPVYFAPLTYGEPLAAQTILGTAEKIAAEETAAAGAGAQDAPKMAAGEADLFATAATAAPNLLKTHEDVVRRQIELMLAQIPIGARKIALAHVFLTGATESDSERPLSIGGTTTVSKNVFDAFDYTALGHLHMCQSCGDKIRYGGSLLKYSFNETSQKKGVHVLDLDATGKFTAETIPLTARHELGCLEGTFAELLQDPKPEDKAKFLQITLTDPLPILDAKYKLEQVYPHILHLQYARLAPRQDQAGLVPGKQQLDPAALFKNFYRQTEGRELTAAEQELLTQALADAGREEQES